MGISGVDSDPDLARAWMQGPRVIYPDKGPEFKLESRHPLGLLFSNFPTDFMSGAFAPFCFFTMHREGSTRIKGCCRLTLLRGFVVGWLCWSWV